MIRFDDVTMVYTPGAQPALDHVSLEVEREEFVFLVGKSGSGKSTFLKVVLGLTGLNAGEISVLGKPARLGNAGVGYVPQQKSIPTSTPMRARDLVGLGVDGHRWGIRLHGRKYRAKVDELLEAPAQFAVSAAGTGAQQRLALPQGGPAAVVLAVGVQ